MPRLDVAVIHRDGTAQVVNAARPATLVAFSDEHEGKVFPDSPREISWIVHRALEISEPLDEWLPTLEDISASRADVRLARRIIAGDEDARAEALGEKEREDEDEESPLEDPEKTLELLAAIRGGRS